MQNPPEYRRYRQAVWGIFAAVAAYACVALAVSGFRGARARSGLAPEPAPLASVDRAALSACTRDLEALHQELIGRLNAVLKSEPARMSAIEWEDWMPTWRQRLLEVGARCRLERGDVQGSKPVQVAYARLGELQRHFTTLSTQFAKEVGPHADQTRQALEAARRGFAE